MKTMSKEINYFEEENEWVKGNFNLDEILEFQLEHEVQIIRHSDYQFMCYIDRGAYSPSLTPLGALVAGIKSYKERNEKS